MNTRLPRRKRVRVPESSLGSHRADGRRTSSRTKTVESEDYGHSDGDLGKQVLSPRCRRAVQRTLRGWHVAPVEHGAGEIELGCNPQPNGFMPRATAQNLG